MKTVVGDRDRREFGWTRYVWLIYLIFYFASLALGKPTPWQLGWSLAAVAAFLPLYFLGFRSSGTRLLVIAFAILGIGLAITPINPAGACFFIYATAFLGMTSRPRVAVRWLALMLVLVTAEGLFFALPFWWSWMPAVVVAGVVGATNIHFAEIRRRDSKLRVAQEAVEEMARIAERERIGRDLHDLLGHTLSLVVLKAELASKLADRDPARAAAEIRDVERIARDALVEVRKAVRGYRSDTLADEVANAERVLVAAGVSATIDLGRITFTPDEDRALAFAVREAITNVVRHAGATSCHIRLARDAGRVVLEVRDNGRGGMAPEGSGLSGMRERLRQVAGTLERDGQQGTRLVMSLPVHGGTA